MTAAPATPKERLAILLAKDLRPDDRTIMVGANMPVARAAAIYANLTTHPDAQIMLGMGWQALGDGGVVPPVYPFTFDPRTLQADSWMHQSYVFDNMHYPDVFFIGGLQVDRRANVNLFGIPGTSGGWAMRGPGGIGISTQTSHARGYYVVMLHHEPRVFVERVALITALGDRHERARVKLPGGGVRLVLSPLGVFGLDDDGNLAVVSLQDGVEPETVRAATGFPIDVPKNPPRTEPIAPDELRLLRDRVDPGGTLRR